MRNIQRLKTDMPMTKGVLGGGYLLHNVTATSSLLLSRDYKESPPSPQLVGVLWVGGDVVQLVEVSSGRSWCLSGLDCHVCQSCVSLRVGRLVTDQYYLGDKVVEKVRLVGAVYLDDWLDGQCGQVGQVVGMLEQSSQDDISNTE